MIFLIWISLNNLYPNGIKDYQFHPIPISPYYHGFQNVARDSIGYLWYHGRDALFVYDGNSSKPINIQTTNLDENLNWRFNYIHVDNNKQLYIATNLGLLKYDYATREMNLVINGFINSIAQGEDNKFWMVRNNKIELFDPLTEKIIKSNDMPWDDASKIPTVHKNIEYANGFLYFFWNGNIYKINEQLTEPVLHSELKLSGIVQIKSHKDKLYILTEKKGIYRLDENGIPDWVITDAIRMDHSVSLKRIFIDANDVLWVGTQNGLYLYDIKTKDYILLQQDISRPNTLPHNSIWSINGDPDGGVWISTFGGNLLYASLKQPVTGYKTIGRYALNNSVVSCFQEDGQGNLWIGTEGGGMNFWNKEDNTFKYFTTDSYNMNSNLVKKSYYDDKNNSLIIAFYNGGIQSIDLTTMKAKDWHFYSPSSPLNPFNAYDLILDNESGLWALNSDSKNFLAYQDLKTGKVETVHLDFSEFTQDQVKKVECMSLTRDGYLLLFTHNGLFKVDTKSKKIVAHYFIVGQNSLTNVLLCFTTTSNGDIWIGTQGGGINILTKDGRYYNLNIEFKDIPKTVYSIEEDPITKDIWMATEDGIWHYMADTNKFAKATFLDAELCGAFYPRSSFASKNGYIYFGGTNGFIYFESRRKINDSIKPEVHFTAFYINRNLITPTDDKSPISKDISVMKGNSKEKIKLTYKQSNLKFEFTTDSYIHSHKNIFACRLLGASSDEWQVLPKGQTYIQYFNLPPGNYQLQVKATNEDMVWSDKISSLYFSISNPPWLSWQAILVIMIVLMVAVYWIWKYFTDRKILQNELELERKKEAQTQELIQLRVDFFTNISHDLKTALSLIMNPLKHLQGILNKSSDSKSVVYARMIESNASRIQRMINQLLEFRQIESKKVTLNNSSGDIIHHIHNIWFLFESYAEKKSIEVIKNTDSEHLYAKFDYDVVEKIFSNLFSNAIKYTPQNEKIILSIAKSTTEDLELVKELSILNDPQVNYTYYTFKVANTGVEISDKQYDLIFKAFNKLIKTNTGFESSYGLGLSIVYGLVQALNGIIVLENDVRNEVCFKIILPLEIENEQNIDSQYLYQYTLSNIKDILTENESQNEESEAVNRSSKKYNIVIIEDNDSLRGYLKKEIGEFYNVFTAENGVEGMELIKKIKPMLVITDLLMPEMNGFEVCEEIKSNDKLATIPVIILSGLGNNAEHKVKGLKVGADVFIDKPFDMTYLLQQIENLIKAHENLKDHFSTKYTVDPTKVEIVSEDEQILQRATMHAENNLHNEYYDVDAFVSDMNIGRTLLYQKIKDLTGMSIKEFILDLRLKRSIQLLLESDLTISEIATQTGFSNGSYFSVCFKKYYKISPTKYREEHKL